MPSSTLPLPLTLCHCNVCRHQTGLLAASYVTLPKSQEGFEVHGATTSYRASEAITRFFCSICGSNVYVEEHDFDDVSLCSGVVAHNEGGTISQLQNQIFVSDTKDGGMSVWLPTISGWEGFSNKSKSIDCSSFRSPASHYAEDEAGGASKAINNDSKVSATELQCHCHCQRVQFKITRPNEQSRQCHSPFPDLLVPYISSDPQTIANEEDIKWWLPSTSHQESSSAAAPPPTKYLAGLCACTTCRKTSGFDIQAWAFIPTANLLSTDKDNSPLDFTNTTTSIPNLSKYTSSNNTHRHFCTHCGATIFWRNETRPHLIDVSAGLLSASASAADDDDKAAGTGAEGEKGKRGVRAESWLEWWTERISFEEEAPNRALIESVKDGLKGWNERRATSP